MAAGYVPIFKILRETSTERLGQWADLLVIESELGPRALHSAERLRRPGMPPVGVLVSWRSDLEWDARHVADFVLHVPIAPDEVRDALAFVVPRRRKDASAVPGAAAEQARAGSGA